MQPLKILNIKTLEWEEKIIFSMKKEEITTAGITAWQQLTISKILLLIVI